MGTKVAHTYATLTMGYLEETLFYPSLLEILGEEIGKYIKEIWRRYRDDCFVIWRPELGNINDLHTIINSLNELLQFSMESNDTELPFLDIRIYKETNRLETDIYHKATDTFQYLNYTSYHPRHIKQNIPFSIARRICTIVSNPQIKETRLQELSNHLLKRNYPLQIIQDGIKRAKLIPLKDLRKTKINKKKIIN